MGGAVGAIASLVGTMVSVTSKPDAPKSNAAELERQRMEREEAERKREADERRKDRDQRRSALEAERSRRATGLHSTTLATGGTGLLNEPEVQSGLKNRLGE